MPVRELKLSQIRTDGGTQSREKLNKKAVEAYTEKLQDEGVKFPAIEVIQDGDNYWLADGFHRFEAHRLAGVGVIEANVEQGTLRDAILKSVGSNDTHGVQRTDADKRYAVKLLLNDPKWSTASNRWIAKAANVHHTFVGRMKDQLVPAPVEKTIGQDGRKRPAKRKTKLDKLREKFPNLSEAHFKAAEKWKDAEEYLKWADEQKANAKEMEAYRRIQRGEPSPEKTPPAPTTAVNTPSVEEQTEEEEGTDSNPENVSWTTRSLEAADQIRKIFSSWPIPARILIEEVLYDLSKEDNTKW